MTCWWQTDMCSVKLTTKFLFSFLNCSPLLSFFENIMILLLGKYTDLVNRYTVLGKCKKYEVRIIAVLNKLNNINAKHKHVRVELTVITNCM